MNGIVPDRPFALKTVEESARYLRISKSLMQHLTAARKVAFTRLGRRIYFQQSDLDDYSARQRVEAEIQGAGTNPSVVIYKKKHCERRFIVRPGLADALIELLDKKKRFWEWEEDLELLQKIRKAQAAMIDELQRRLDENITKEKP